jgi:hypothetical protein
MPDYNSVKEKFAKPAGLEELGLISPISRFLEPAIEKFGAFCSFYLDDITNALYQNGIHTGVEAVRLDKTQKIREYSAYLNENGFTKDQKNFLWDQYFRVQLSGIGDMISYIKNAQTRVVLLKKGNISNNLAGYLWAFYPNKDESLAAVYESRLKEEIKGALEERIDAWKRASTGRVLRSVV